MKPWIGCKYHGSNRRLAIVGESHYIPDFSTKLNFDSTAWYASSQEQALSNEEDRNWMNTIHCIKEYRDPGKESHETYRKIEEALKEHSLCFDEIAFFNYIFRPVWECAGGYSNSCFNIEDKDRAVSAEIMHWFISEHCPTNIVIASSVIARWTCVDVVLRDYAHLSRVVTHHPTARNGHFKKGVSRALEKRDSIEDIIFQPNNLKNGGRRISQKSCKELGDKTRLIDPPR